MMRKTGVVGMILGLALVVVAGISGKEVLAEGAVMNDQQIQGLIETAGKATDRPDHDFAANSIRNILEHAKDLQLSPDQLDKIKKINDHYAQTKTTRERAYQQSEMEALKLIHDRHSSLSAVEAAVQKADMEHSKVRMAGVAAVREAGDVLRPEQYSQWRQKSAGGQVAHSQEGLAAQGQPEQERVAPH
jgi:periplasmic protein CpxP/Spy